MVQKNLVRGLDAGIVEAMTDTQHYSLHTNH